jgi:putative methyltransferase (TIGR04325 family)
MIDQLISLVKKTVAAGAEPPAVEDIRFTGDYASWEEAARDAVGYDAAVILERTRDALLQVKNGAAAFERDSVLFDKPQYSFPVIAGLLRAALAGYGRLAVLDFGGSLGTTYFQCRPLLRTVASIEWSIVEQAAHVRCGRAHFAGPELHFYTDVDECVRKRRPDTLLLSSVLQYLPAPYATLEQLLRQPWRHVLIDRTAFLAAGRDRLTVQHVPESIYPATYPAWFFSEAKLTAAVAAAGYTLVADFAGADRLSPVGEPGYYKGFIYERARR